MFQADLVTLGEPLCLGCHFSVCQTTLHARQATSTTSGGCVRGALKESDSTKRDARNAVRMKKKRRLPTGHKVPWVGWFRKSSNQVYEEDGSVSVILHSHVSTRHVHRQCSDLCLLLLKCNGFVLVFYASETFLVAMSRFMSVMLPSPPPTPPATSPQPPSPSP